MDKKYLTAGAVAAMMLVAAAVIYVLRNGALQAAMIWAALVFVVGSVAIVLGTLSWLGRVDKHALLRSEEKIQNKDALVIGAFFMLLLLLAYCVTAAAAAMQFPERGAAAVLLALTWALASATVGGAFGFLLGHPRRLPDDKTDRAGLSGLLRTGLDDMVDWLVKGLTTVLLVQSGPILTHLQTVARQMALGLITPGAAAMTDPAVQRQLDAAAAFSQPLIVCFTLLGALSTCLVTRTYLTGALSRADRTTTGAFGRVGLDLGEVLLLSNAQHSLTTRNLDPGAEVRQVAERLSGLSLPDLHSVQEFWMWAKAKVMLGHPDDALKGYEKAVAECDCDPALLLDYGVALHAAKKSAEALARFRLAYDHLARGTDVDTRRNVYKSLTFELLNDSGNYDRVIELVNEFEDDRQKNPAPVSGSLLVNKACAYGQMFIALAKHMNVLVQPAPPNEPFKYTLQGDPPSWPTEYSALKTAYQEALAAVRKALESDRTWKTDLQELLRRPKEGEEAALSGLEAFERFSEFRAIVDLPPLSEKPAATDVAETTKVKNPQEDVGTEERSEQSASGEPK